jgi:pyruvate dehydrogenase E2 component (dihydrolipoamide acetyltransferase)
MAKIMQMPKLSDTMKEGVVARWLAKEGDKVRSGVPLLEIETDKATMEFEASASGVLLKILVGDGQTCPLQAPIAVIGKEGEDWQRAIEEFNSQSAGSSSPSGAKSQTPSGATSAVTSEPESAPPVGQTSNSARDRIKASPLARKMARDKGLDLSVLQGTGPNGRIVARDLAGTPTPSTQVSSASSGSPATSAEVERLPLSMMRKTIATRLTESVHTAPHFYLTVSIAMDTVLKWRQETLTRLGADKKFSVNDVLILMVARALKKHPQINASWQGDHIAQYRDVHMGMAVALPTGLITPVIRNADKQDVLAIANQTKELSKRAKEGTLKPEDYQGGTFTISNLGMAGIEHFTAIINPPQAAILAVGASIPTPVVDASGQVAVETRMKVTLSCDHRVIDGAVGSEFLKTLKSFIEDPINALMLG